MPREKSREELEQETRDAELARQLSMQEEQQARQYQPQQVSQPTGYGVGGVQPVFHPQQHQQPPRGVIQVMCPSCISVNHINPQQAHMQHVCGVCGRVLPPSPQRVEAAPPSMPQNAVRCGSCGAINSIPASNSTQFMCGACQRLLTISRPPPMQTQPQGPMVVNQGGQRIMYQNSPSTPPQQPVYQQQQQQQQPQYQQPQPPQQQAPQDGTVHVRCGRCPAVNAVRGGPKTQFQCGSCGAINEIP